MGEYVTLLGAEDVLRAGHAVREAANDIRFAAAHIVESLQILESQQAQRMDDWLQRFEGALRSMTEEPSFVRADRNMICSACTQAYWRHYPANPWLWLTRLCDGSMVKL